MAIGHPKLQHPGKILCGPSKQPLDSLGCITVQLIYKQCRIRHYIYIVQSLNQSLLGLPTILALNIFSRLDNLSIASTIPSDLFQGLGIMNTEYEVKLQHEAKPFVPLRGT